MGIDELQVIDVDVILENCPIALVILNLLVYNSTIQYSDIALTFFPPDWRMLRRSRLVLIFL